MRHKGLNKWREIPWAWMGSQVFKGVKPSNYFIDLTILSIKITVVFWEFGKVIPEYS